MIIQGLTLEGGFLLDPPMEILSKFVAGGYNANGKGAAYVYNLDGTGEQKITASDGANGDTFSYSVAMSGTKVVVGAPYSDEAGNSSGSVYVYNLDGTGEVKITASDAAGDDVFGYSVAINEDKVIVGAYGNDDAASRSGSVYVYNTDGTGEQKITASDGVYNSRFGWSVAVSDNHIVVGANGDDDRGIYSGSVYVYNTDGTGQMKITASDGAEFDSFGFSVAVTDNHIVVGAPNNDDPSNSGSVYVYNLDGTGQVKITASDGELGDAFGYSVAVSDNHIVVGAPEDDDAGSQSGSVYVYNLDGTGEQKITASDGAQNDQFGYSVAIQGDKIIVGAQGDDDAGNRSGAVYVYNTDGTGEQKIVASDATGDEYLGFSVATN
jgi:meiotically up-regulated gene 157 (Mug157) protein